MSKYYVVWKGRTPGVYGSWEECKDETNGYPSAQFKSYSTKSAADNAYALGVGAWFSATKWDKGSRARRGHAKLTHEYLNIIGKEP